MSQLRLIPPVIVASVLGGLLAVAIVLSSRAASALPPAGTDNFGVNAQVAITSLLGSETISFSGSVTITRDAPHSDNGTEVEDFHITDLHLSGLSATGFVSINQSPTVPSNGQLRSLQQQTQFPASSFFDLNIDAAIPASGQGSPVPFLVHNETALHIVPMSSGSEVSLASWPPFSVKYQQTPNPCIHMLNAQIQDPWLPAEICVTNVSVQLGEPNTATSTPGGPTTTATLSTPTASRTSTRTSTATRTSTPTRTATRTPTITNTPTITSTPTDTPTLGAPTETPTPTATLTPTSTASATVPASVTPTQAATATPTATVNVAPTATTTPTPTTTSTATATLIATATPSPTPHLAGDANCNNHVDAIDAALILQFAAGLFHSLPCSGAADVNHDGRVNSVDSALILQFVAGLLERLPV